MENSRRRSCASGNNNDRDHPRRAGDAGDARLRALFLVSPEAETALLHAESDEEVRAANLQHSTRCCTTLVMHAAAIAILSRIRATARSEGWPGQPCGTRSRYDLQATASRDVAGTSPEALPDDAQAEGLPPAFYNQPD